MCDNKQRDMEVENTQEMEMEEMEGKVFITTDPNQSGNGSENGPNKRINKWFIAGLVALCVQFVSIIIGIEIGGKFFP